MMTIAEMETYMKKNKHITQVPQVLNISGGVMGINMKNDGGWKDNLCHESQKTTRQVP